MLACVLYATFTSVLTKRMRQEKTTSTNRFALYTWVFPQSKLSPGNSKPCKCEKIYYKFLFFNVNFLGLLGSVNFHTSKILSMSLFSYEKLKLHQKIVDKNELLFECNYHTM